MRPMLATKGTYVPRGEEWVHEVKWDGVRALTEVRDGRLRMYSRNDNDVTVAWPELSTSPLGDRDLLVDGEIIALNEHGLPDFRVLQDRMHLRNAQTRAPARRRPTRRRTWSSTCSASTARTSRALPLEERRARLEGLGLDDARWQVPAAYDDGPMLFDATLAAGPRGRGQQAPLVDVLRSTGAPTRGSSSPTG